MASKRRTATNDDTAQAEDEITVLTQIIPAPNDERFPFRVAVWQPETERWEIIAAVATEAEAEAAAKRAHA